MRRISAALLLAGSLAGLPAQPASADGEKAGEFDYYVLALSWSPTFCSLKGDREGSDQCDPRHDFSFTLHGLWPQFESGWPQFCTTTQRDPSRSDTKAMADIMGTDGLAWHEWKAHGRCSGLSSQDYYATARKAYEKIVIPDVFRNLQKEVKLPVSVVEEAFTEANPGMTPTGITVLCDEDRIDSVRICMTKDLELRDCGQDTARDCRMLNALMEPVR
jgi:ribonuclease T2